MRAVPTFGRYLQGRFGCRVRKIPLSIPGFTCPNIDGFLGRGGCTYCENESFSPNLKGRVRQTLSFSSENNTFLEEQKEALSSQYRQSAHYYIKNHKVSRFIAYFQSFSNTYAPLKTLQALYEYALLLPGCVGLSVGTRADCLQEESMEYLGQLSQTHPLWVEIGVQSAHDRTLETIRRMEQFGDMALRIDQLHRLRIPVCAHLIFGLPGESSDQMLQSVQRVLDLGVSSIKLHPLYVVKNTALAAQFKAGAFEPILEDVYLDLVTKSINMLPPGVTIQRVSAGVDDDSLMSPLWCRNKNKFMGHLRQHLLKEGWHF